MLARGEQRQYEWVNLGEMMDEILFFLNRELRHRRIEWVLEVPESLPWLLSQRVHLQQLFLNLILNAMDAMHTPEIPQRQLLIAARLTGEPAIAVCIGDTGPGIAPDIARRLFEPFVTSKPNGIGLGLSICRTLAEEQGGRIKVRSVAGRGTLFHVTLPVGPGTDRHGN
jgi:C4-dicarboxylate-specific signal transduction histidine kinase